MVENIKNSFWLRDETKPGEKRTPLLPENAKTLIEQGHTVTVEKSKTRCFSDSEYEAVGCKLVESGSWMVSPTETIILGLKELENTKPSVLIHNHIHFAHCFKDQTNSSESLSKFADGNGTLFDLEYLYDEDGRRVVAFGESAGFVGMGLGILAWCEQNKTGEQLSALKYYESSEEMLDLVSKKIEIFEKNEKFKPKILIIGYKGRSGSGALKFCEKIGVECLKWDSNDTKKDGPFLEILDFDILINCVKLRDSNNNPFITKELLEKNQKNRNLSMIVDVSCDVLKDNNPSNIFPDSVSMSF